MSYEPTGVGDMMVRARLSSKCTNCQESARKIKALEAKQAKALELVELWRKEANRLNRSVGMMMHSDGGNLIELAIKDIEDIYKEGEE